MNYSILMRMTATIILLASMFLVHTDTASAETNGKIGGEDSVSVKDTTGNGHMEGDTQKSLKDAILFQLSGYEYFPKRTDLEKLGNQNQITEILIDIVKNHANSIYRLKAVDALGYYSSPEVTQFLNDIAHGPNSVAQLNVDERLEIGLQHRSITALAKSLKEQSISYLEDLLGNDLQIDLTVIDALGKNAGYNGRLVIENYVNSSADPLAKREAEKFLQ